MVAEKSSGIFKGGEFMDIQVDNAAKDYITKKVQDKSINIVVVERPGRS